MRRLPSLFIPMLSMLVLIGCGGSSSAGPSSDTTAAGEPQSADDPAQLEAGAEAEDNEFQLSDSDTAEDAHGATPSEIEATETEAAMRFFVVDKDEGPVEGIVIKMTAPDGEEFYTRQSDSEGYAEVLVPVGQKYEIEYLSLGRQTIMASVPVPAEPHQDIKLTLRYKRHDRASQSRASAQGGGSGDSGEPDPPTFELEGVRFDSGKATLRPESHERLDRVVEYMTHKSDSRIRIAGHTDNVGNARANQRLSEKRAQAVREYLVSQGIDGGRIEAVGHGSDQPVASNDTEEGRQKNRRIEAIEL